ncbi:hypothetical protein A2954_00935 [Candidatus Roizmanbacteria bacterium RIFCSPLOWO2_01_FULL_37_12]|uniref:Uncharacterized protein n=1 Tax=Candidatus Roizmanbacteria bacterium RIFCSPLOWO2_01_FULL_37_12 TaxID=1802056 RepID=A0A1F7IG99_9BACT|nr:MAG: hypothetical protein A3D76_06935 [Candidatus Roizmanbacteria bacterium RIFCSPHIGHO2_02_FULL_37_9b]OGK42393.1 MAG: hypothetical protein A2954_00935 [Candidatus Roizmanbacteria bacterium RIFCSPLOWO2_01_FULL_37_12]
MNSLGFAVPTTEDILYFLFNITTCVLIVTLLIKATILKFSKRKNIKKDVNYLTAAYSSGVLILLLTFLTWKKTDETLISNLAEVIVYDLIGGLILLVTIFVLLKILDFIFNLTSIKKLIIFVFILILGLVFYPKKYTSEVLERLYEGSPSKSNICRCAGLIKNNMCIGYKFKCEIKKHSYL